MSRVLEDLRRRMAEATAALDFEAAARLRDQISRLEAPPEVEGSRLRRQEPGRMGLGTSDQAMVPPPGWKPPKRPDPMTTGTRPAKRRKD